MELLVNNGNIIDVIETKKVYGILLLGALYQAIKAACFTLDFRFIDISGYIFTGTALIYPMLYVLLDAITRISGKLLAIKLAILFEITSGIFILLLYTINLLPSASINLNLLPAFTSIFDLMTFLYFSSMFGSFFAGIVGVLVYAIIQARLKSFFVASTLSTMIIMLAHNIPTDYMTFHKLYPTECWQIIINDYIINCVILIFTSAFINYFIIKKIAYNIPTF